jgi:hypothetical protein
VMKPKPFSELNHLTVPVAMCDPSFLRRRGLAAYPSGSGWRREGTALGEP